MENFKDTLKRIFDDTQEKIREEEEYMNSLSEQEKIKVLEKRRLEEEAEKAAEKECALIASYKAKKIPLRYYSANWDNWESDSELKRKAFDVVKDNAWSTNLFLCGKSGTGKTHLAMCLTKDGATYRRLPDIFREVRQDFNSEQEIIDFYGSRKLLIIDEVGRQKFSDFEKNLFFEIIDKRWNNMLPTTLITNMNEKEFGNEYGTAVIDRLRPILVRFDWESHREMLGVSAKQSVQIEF
ncbi:MAG: hypothetical protein Ta2A_12010 [Treponemataceae bacterium]|nr:MAG: hypothetical protein Ta2A_12010 [Treponemataceae bacterium]